MYRVTKTISHAQGISVAFRQHRATGHCQYIHGYALAFEFVYEAASLDERNWVVDFAGFKEVRQTLVNMLDHRLVVSASDPQLHALGALDGVSAQVEVVPELSIELFAKMAAAVALHSVPMRDGVRLVEVTCSEHPSNSATWVNVGEPATFEIATWQQYLEGIHVPNH